MNFAPAQKRKIISGKIPLKFDFSSSVL